jgi:hypothetical protein
MVPDSGRGHAHGEPYAHSARLSRAGRFAGFVGRRESSTEADVTLVPLMPGLMFGIRPDPV